MGLLEYAKTELAKIDVPVDDEMQPTIHACILEAIAAFAKPGHSGTSAEYTIELLFRLLQRKPLSPLTGKDDEWEDRRSCGEPKTAWQNKRCPEVFKQEDGTAWYLNKGGKPIGITFPFVVPDEPIKESI